MKKCLVDIALHPKAEEKLREHYEIVYGLDSFQDVDAAIVYSVPYKWAENATRLKAIGCHTYSHQIADWLGKNGIKITTADSLWRTVAEHTLALCMCAARNVVAADKDIHNNKWNNHTELKIKHSGVDFQNKVFGIWGMGRIGKELAAMIKGFNMKVLYNDLEKLDTSIEKELNVTMCSIDYLLENSDYFCILVPHNKDTDNIFDDAWFGKLKDGCIFINTARSGIVNKASFIKAIESGKIGSAAIDVTWNEGEGKQIDIDQFENVIMTPHLGGSTYECDMVLVNGICF